MPPYMCQLALRLVAIHRIAEGYRSASRWADEAHSEGLENSTQVQDAIDWVVSGTTYLQEGRGGEAASLRRSSVPGGSRTRKCSKI